MATPMPAIGTRPSSITLPEILPAMIDPDPIPNAVNRKRYPPCTSDK